MKKIGISILAILLLGITIGLIYTKNFAEDKNKSIQKMNQIKESNNILKKSIISYNKNKKTITEYLSIYYEEQFIKDYPNIIELFTKNETIINQVSQQEKILNGNCKNQIYQDKEVNNICKTHANTYQKLLEVYQRDIESFNQTITIYNDNTKEKLNLFQSKYIKNNNLNTKNDVTTGIANTEE